MSHKKLGVSAALILVAILFVFLGGLRKPAPIHAQDASSQLYLNRAQRVETILNQAAGPAAPLSLASDDFDGDGIRDLAVGVATPTGGLLTIRRGNMDAFAPQSGSTLMAIARNEFPAPYLPGAQLIPLSFRPDLIAAGDFIGQNGPGLAAAARGGRSLHVIARGDSGNLETLQEIDLGGAITALGAEQLHSGNYASVVLGVLGDNGPQLRIFTGSHDGLAETGRFPLQGEVTSIAFGNLDGDSTPDTLVVAGGQVLIVHGERQTVETVQLPFQSLAAIAGSFVLDRNTILSVAVLATDGSLHVLANDQRDSRPFAKEELRALRTSRLKRQSVTTAAARQRRVVWKEVESYASVVRVPVAGKAPLMFRTRISSNALDDVLLLDASALTVLTHPDSDQQAGRIITRADLGADAVAALPERVNIDGRPGVVYVQSSDLAPFVMMPLPDPTFTVNRTDDPTPPTPINSACNGGPSDCSLRDAILKANATPGTDTVIIPAGTYTISLARVANDFTGRHGAIDVTDSVNIVGAGAATTLISSTVDKAFSFNQDIAAFTNATVTLSSVTIQNSTNNGDVIIQDGWGGAFDFDTGGSNSSTATATLTITGCKIINNSTTDGEGGGFAVFNTNQGTGSATISASTVSGNTANRGASDPNGPGNGGGIMVAWPARLTMNNTQVLSNTAKAKGTGFGVGGGLYIIGGGGVTNSVTIHGSQISSNTAAGDGGGIWSTAGLTIDTGTAITNNISGGSGGGIWFNGDPGDPATLTKVTITGNAANGTATGSAGTGGGIHVGSAGQPLSISYSRIALNTAKTTASKALNNQTSGGAGSAVTAINNWWGTNTPSTVIAPATSTCSAGAFQVCFAPYIPLTFTPGATPILVGGSTVLTASFLKDSASNSIAASNLNVLAGLPITFNNPQHGSLSGAQAAIQNVQSVTGASESGTTATITTSLSHGFSIGQGVTVAGVGPGYDGLFSITGVTTNTFSYTASVSGLATLGAGGTAAVPVGTATVNFQGTTVGPGAVDAVIDGATVTSTIVAVNSNTNTAASDQTATYKDTNQNVTLSATLTTPSGCCTVTGGTVTFTVFNGATQVGAAAVSATVSGGTASATYVLPGGTSAGAYSIHAAYSGTSTGTGDYLSSSDNSHSLTVNQAPTTTTATNAVATYSASNQTVPLSATVSSANGAINAGTVTFTVFDSGLNPVGSPVTSGTVSGGSASANFTPPGGTPLGTYSIQASYSGSTNFLGSSDTTHTLAINGPTTTTVSPASATFSNSSQTVVLSASVGSIAGNVNTGNVTFTVFDGATQIGSAAISGALSGGVASANFTLPAAAAAKTYSIHASYSGGGNFLASSDNTQSLVVNQASTTIVVANSTASFSASNQSVTLSATVTSPAGTVNTGTVAFKIFNQSNVQVGATATSGTVASGAASASYTLPGGTPAGVYTIQADYSGTTNLLTSNDNTHTLTITASTTTTASNATAAYSVSNQSVTLSATVTSAGGTVNAGTVTFTVFNSSNVQVGAAATSGTVSSGSASATYTLPGGSAAGSYSIHASYSGGGTFSSSNDNSHTLTVTGAGTTTSASNASATFSPSNQSVTLSAAVSGSSAVNEGTVTFTVKNGAITIGAPVTSGTVSGGAASASFTLPGGTPVAAYTIQAVYNPGPNFTGSNDSSHTLTVGKATPTITWSNPADVVFGSALSSMQLNATASVPGTFVYTPGTGTVLPAGNGQTLSVAFTPTDTTNYNNANRSVLINVLPGAGPASLAVTRTLARDVNTNEVVVTLTIANTGGSPATAVQLTSAKIGTTITSTTLPAAIPDIPGGGSSSIVLRFPGSVGTPGTAAVLAVSGTYSGGGFTGSFRSVLP